MKKCKCPACKQDRRIARLEQRIAEVEQMLANKAATAHYGWTPLTITTTPGTISTPLYAGHGNAGVDVKWGGT